MLLVTLQDRPGLRVMFYLSRTPSIRSIAYAQDFITFRTEELLRETGSLLLLSTETVSFASPTWREIIQLLGAPIQYDLQITAAQRVLRVQFQ